MKIIKKSLLLIGRNFYLYQFFLMFILINQLAIDFIDCYLMLLFLEPGPGRGGGGDNATCLGKFMVASIP